MMKNKTRTYKRGAVAVALLCVFVLALAGCAEGCASMFGSSLKSMAFKEKELRLNVGDVYDVTSSVLTFEPALASNKNFELSSSDESVVSADNRTLTAISAGEAVITAVSVFDSDIKADCKVFVNYAEPTGVKLQTAGELLQYVGDVSEVKLTAASDNTIDPATEFEWTVNGSVVEETSDTFNFTPPNTAGTYKISVRLGGVTASATLRVFTAPVTDVAAVSDGNLQQTDIYTAVTVTLSYNKTAGDPDPSIEWFVNGELYLADSKLLKFTPSAAGEYDIAVKVNGEAALIDGKDKITVTAKGSVVPTGLKVEYDDIYPDVIIKWNYPHTAGMKYQLKIENLTLNTVDESLTGTNASAAGFFSGASFNAGTILDLTAATYRISVRSLGDGELYSQSDYSESVITRKLDAKAVTYLTNKTAGGLMDHYITDDEEYCELYSYYMAFRQTKNKVSYNIYMGYDSSLTQDRLIEEAFNYGATTGSYSYSATGGRLYGSEVKVETWCDNSVVPSVTGGGSVYDPYLALEPHVAENSDRTAQHVFATDTRAVSTAVKTSEELFRVVELGARPAPVSGSTAEKLYNFAKGLLREIISDDMTDAEKVHAIYDWIMWNVQYDYEATTVKEAAKAGGYKAYYLDGVLTNMNAYAVCDGMSKTLSLLCNMEGIPAVRVTGMAGGSVAGMAPSVAKKYKEDNWGGHAWNKVYVEGEWYVVDPTWGDSAARIGYKNYEMALHDFLLISDSDIADTHEYDVSVNNPATASEAYNIYDNLEYGYVNAAGESVTVDTYIDSLGASMFDEVASMMEYLNYLKGQASRAVTIYNKSLSRSQVAVEISAPDSIFDSVSSAADSTSASKNPFVSALSALGYSSSQYKIMTFQDVILVTLKI